MQNREMSPRMMTVREVASTGVLSEHALRVLLKKGNLPAIYVGNKALINFDKLCENLNSLSSNVITAEEMYVYDHE